MLCRPGVAKGKGKEGKGKGPLGKHPISKAPKLDAALHRTDEASDASDGDSIGANSSQEAADDSNQPGPGATASRQGAFFSWQLHDISASHDSHRGTTAVSHNQSEE